MNNVGLGQLILIPTELAEKTTQSVISPQIVEYVEALDFFAVENLRSARRFIRRVSADKVIDEIRFEIFDKKSSKEHAEDLMMEVLTGKSLGILSEAGCPGVADPGAKLVEKAHEMGVKVIPLVGPSSILLALMASGMNGQSFTFHGYLPIQDRDRSKMIKELERKVVKDRQTQIFMETPFRNNKMLEELVKACNSNTKLCVACNITAENEYIETLTIGEWKKMKVDLHKKPVMFVMGK